MNGFEELPMGLAMALARNPEAMKAFSEMSEQEKQGLIDITHCDLKIRDAKHRCGNCREV